MTKAVLWFRRDLRLSDLPALVTAAESGSVVPLFVVDPALMATAGPVRGRCLVSALAALQEQSEGALVVRHGNPTVVLPAFVAETGASSVHISAEVHPFGRRRDEKVRRALHDIPLVATGSPYAVDPGKVRKKDGSEFRVFTPYSRGWREHGWPGPAEQPGGFRFATGIDSEDLPEVETDPAVRLPECSERAAWQRWAEFRESALPAYGKDRDRPDRDGTSQLSMDLKFGTIHPRSLLAELHDRSGNGVERFVAELCWREFYADVVWHQPDSVWQDLNPAMAELAYDDPEAGSVVAERFAAWREGRTGYPMVDAGMRQLRTEGWMHNRVRMVTASFLTKHLHIWWPRGARYFLHWLRDGDMASNNHGWQWVAGTGTDAAPYFRVFNPVIQGEKFDPQGDYVRRHVPELRHLPGKSVHQPWKADDGYAHGYPERIVDLATERGEALARYEVVKGQSFAG